MMSRVKKPIVSPLGAASPSWLVPITPPGGRPTFLMTIVGLPGMCAGRCLRDDCAPRWSDGPPAG